MDHRGPSSLVASRHRAAHQRRGRTGRRRIAALSVASMAAGIFVLILGPTPQAGATITRTASFSTEACTSNTWRSAAVPAGTISATFELWGGGGAGGNNNGVGVGGAGGKGGYVKGTFDISSGFVAARLGCGGDGGGTGASNGFASGGTVGNAQAGTGGGASALCVGATAAVCGTVNGGTMIAIAGGGGGGSYAIGNVTGCTAGKNGVAGGDAGGGATFTPVAGLQAKAGADGQAGGVCVGSPAGGAGGGGTASAGTLGTGSPNGTAGGAASSANSAANGRSGGGAGGNAPAGTSGNRHAGSGGAGYSGGGGAGGGVLSGSTNITTGGGGGGGSNWITNQNAAGVTTNGVTGTGTTTSSSCNTDHSAANAGKGAVAGNDSADGCGGFVVVTFTIKATGASFTAAPNATTPAGVAFATQPVVNVLAGGTGYADHVVTLSITPGTGMSGAVLSCDSLTVVTNSSGNASFSGCEIDRPGLGYRLRATTESGTVITDSATPFDVRGYVAATPSTCSGSWSNLTVPSGIIQTSVSLTGGGGGAGGADAGGNRSGHGGGGSTVKTTIPRSAAPGGQALSLALGCGGGGGYINSDTTVQGGFSAYGAGGNGGNNSQGGAGGGATALCKGTGGCTSELVVAAGGGGGGGIWRWGCFLSCPDPLGGDGGNGGSGVVDGDNGGNGAGGGTGAGGGNGGVGGASANKTGAGGAGNGSSSGGGGGGGGRNGGAGGASADATTGEAGGGGGAGDSYSTETATYSRDTTKQATTRQRESCAGGSLGRGGAGMNNGTSNHGPCGEAGAASVTWLVGAASLDVTTQPAPTQTYGTAFGFEATLKDYQGNLLAVGDTITGTPTVTFNQGVGCPAPVSSGSASYTIATGKITVTGVQAQACANPSTLTVTAVDATTGTTLSGTTNGFVVNRANQTISFTSVAPSNAVVGGSYVVSATASSGLTVSYSLDVASSGCSIAGSVVSFTDAGSCLVNADQGGNGNWNSAPTVTQSFMVRRATSTGVSCAPAPISYDQSGSCTVTVGDTSSGVKVTPTGSIVLFAAGDGSGSFGPCNLAEVSLGTASCTASASFSLQDTYAVTATFGETSVHAESSSAPLAYSVRNHNTSTVVSCSPSSLVAGSPTSCTATVTDTQVGVTKTSPTGTVVFGQSGGGTFSSTTCALSTGVSPTSSCTVQFTPTFGGAKTVTASFDGFSSGAAAGGFKHRSSSAVPVPLTVSGSSAQHPTSTSVSCSPNPVQVSTATTCTAIVTDTMTFAATATPTGTVNFAYSGGGALSPTSCTLTTNVVNVSAKCSVTFTPNGIAGSKTVQANYAGVPVLFKASGSGSVFVTATAAPVTPPTPQVQHPTSTSVSCSPSTLPLGNASTCTVTVTDTYDGTTSSPAGTVSVGSSGGGTLSAPTCTLQPSGNGVTSTCQVTFTPTGAKGSKTVIASYAGTPEVHKASGSGSFYLNAT